MNGKQAKALKKAIKNQFLTDKEKERIYEIVKDQPGDVKKNIEKEFFKPGGFADNMYRKGKKKFNNLSRDDKDTVIV